MLESATTASGSSSAAISSRSRRRPAGRRSVVRYEGAEMAAIQRLQILRIELGPNGSEINICLHFFRSASSQVCARLRPAWPIEGVTVRVAPKG